jgi:hypothetical protein
MHTDEEGEKEGGQAKQGGVVSERALEFGGGDHGLQSLTVRASKAMALGVLKAPEPDPLEASKRRAQQLALNALEKVLRPIAEHQVLNTS